FRAAGYDGTLVKDTVVDIYDNDAPAVLILQSDGSTDVAEGGATDSYQVVLTTQPTQNVVVHLDSIKTRTSAGADTTFFEKQVLVNGVPSATLTFTPANWNVPQTVTVSA